MQTEKKILAGLCAHSELPFVENKKKGPSYGSKNKRKKTGQKSRVGHEYSIQQKRSDRIKQEYIKICNQIRQHNPANTKSCEDRHQKLIIREVNNGKPQVFGRITPVKKHQTQPMEDTMADPFSSALQALKYNKSIQISTNQFPIKNSSAFRYNKKLKPLAGIIMKRLQSDYLSVEKIRMGLKQMREKDYSSRKRDEDYSNDFRSDSVTSQKIKTYQETTNIQNRSFIVNLMSQSLANSQKKNNTEFIENDKQQIQQEPVIITRHSDFIANSSNKMKNPQTLSPVKKRIIPIRRKFSPPFETYFYRDLVWRMNLSNELIIETPLEYEHRLRVYIGKGNNSGLIRGFIKRRIWFAITERMEQANFVWLQLKNIPYFNSQKEWKDEVFRIESTCTNCEILNEGLYNKNQCQKWDQYFQNHQKIQERQDQRLLHRTKYFYQQHLSHFRTHSLPNQLEQLPETEQPPLPRILKIRTFIKSVSEIKEQKMQNHFKNNYVIGNKKTLFKTMSVYYKNREENVFNYLPYTFHVRNGIEDESYFRFLKYFYQRGKEIRKKMQEEKEKEELNNIWIVKPGEFSNRGYGIRVCKTLEEIKNIIKQKQKLSDGTERTYIVQAYLEKPLLYNRRKFDLRHYMMITCMNGVLKGYWYKEGYVRTSSVEYSLNSKDAKIHLTNDAVQKNMPQYGKYQKGNKISYDQLQSYIKKNYSTKNYDFKETILPKMKKITTDIIKACSGSIDPSFHGNNFEIFGLDFMIDADFNVWLIEVNTNPCLEISCPLLGSIIPKMVENALQLTLDCAYPPPVRYTPKGIHYTKNLTQQNKFDLVYDSRIHGINRQSTDVLDENLLQQQDEQYEDDGEQWDQDD